MVPQCNCHRAENSLNCACTDLNSIDKKKRGTAPKSRLKIVPLFDVLGSSLSRRKLQKYGNNYRFQNSRKFNPLWRTSRACSGGCDRLSMYSGKFHHTWCCSCLKERLRWFSAPKMALNNATIWWEKQFITVPSKHYASTTFRHEYVNDARSLAEAFKPTWK